MRKKEATKVCMGNGHTESVWAAAEEASCTTGGEWGLLGGSQQLWALEGRDTLLVEGRLRTSSSNWLDQVNRGN